MRSTLNVSWKNITPIKKVQDAPIPVQIAYAVPTGISFCARYKNTPLKPITIIEKIIHKTFAELTEAIFKPNGQPTSKTAAINKYIQPLLFYSKLFVIP